jgi:hypothetical protein
MTYAMMACENLQGLEKAAYMFYGVIFAVFLVVIGSYIRFAYVGMKKEHKHKKV